MTFLNKITSTPRNLLLIDGIGALVSALFLGGILVKWNLLIGMPIDVLYILAAIAGIFAVYSLSCHFFVKAHWAFYLRMIMIANSLYCVLTLLLVGYYFQELTALGVGYFGLEMLIIVGLVGIEWRGINTDKSESL